MIFGSPIKIYLQVDKERLYPGDLLNYSVIVDLKKSKEIKDINVILRAVASSKTICYYREEGYSGDEDYTSSYKEVTYSISLVSLDQKIPVNTKLNPGRHVFNGVIHIPLNAPTSGKAGIFDIVWSITASVRSFLRTAKDTKIIYVYPPPTPAPQVSTVKRAKGIEVKASLPAFVSRGTTFPLEIHLGALNKPVNCNKIDVKLVHKLYVSESTIDSSAEQCNYPNINKEYYKKTIANNVLLYPGQPIALKTKIPIPKDAEPSFNDGFNYSTWEVQIRCSKGLLSGETVSLDIDVK